VYAVPVTVQWEKYEFEVEAGQASDSIYLDVREAHPVVGLTLIALIDPAQISDFGADELAIAVMVVDPDTRERLVHQEVNYFVPYSAAFHITPGLWHYSTTIDPSGRAMFEVFFTNESLVPTANITLYVGVKRV